MSPTPVLPEQAVPQWPQLLRLALLGTRQNSVAVPAVPGFVPTADAATAPSREQHLLLAAGALALLQKAGYVPALPPHPAPPPAPAEHLPALGPLGYACLQRMVVSSLHLDSLPAYLVRVAAAGRRVPDTLLVPLLHYATRSAETRAVLAPVLGTRGHWLAAQNSEWAHLVVASPPASADPTDLGPWETGSLTERLAWLRQRFAHEAEAARALLLAALPTEPAKVQEALLELLAEHLHPTAEPTLEGLLKSRGQEVRRQAAELLVRLPGAALTERLWARAAPLLQAKRGLLGLGKASLAVALPPAWDKTWLADGIEEKNSRFAYAELAGGGGPTAARLGNLLALLPPSRWCQHLGLAPAELLAAALATDWAVPLLPAWAHSTLLHRDADFAAAFVQLWLRQRPALHQARCVHAINWVALVELLPTATRQALVLEPLLQRVRQQAPDWPADLGYVPGPWPRALSVAVVEVISRTLAHTAVPDAYHNVPVALRDLAWVLPQTVAPRLAAADIPWALQHVEAIEQPHELFRSPLQLFVDNLRFQAELLASLRE
ncbi:hypothetical protein GO988_04755 [Hymenobacter sp. HMF4947]|uniref:Uncharacterized protein n=1 Tax=Hymenobacter ginkgonis TaxID=2682976 RepID=A0A7K1TB46_9BACT|nr:DUF5691 domain-containing protein [Hymenobacter ginkgonis]MVN75630.1 hypothetical protein [Hymenobacter ginkgonis]